MSADDEDHGPAMAALSERQRQFVVAMVTVPGCSNAHAARLAGYSDLHDAAKVRGWYLARNPKVQAALREEAGRRLNSLSVVAANVMMDIMLDPEADRKEKLKAATAVLDRTGFAAAQNINVNKTVTDHSGAALIERIKLLAEKTGVPMERLLGAPEPAKQIDGEVIDVDR